MKRIVIIVLVSLIACLDATGTNLRGRILHKDPNGANPIPNMRVDLYMWNGSEWVDWAFAITDKDGYYYFLNYDKDKRFYVSVLGKYYPPQPLTVQNIQPPLYQDIPTITT
jgi:hypothetical protein